NDRDKRNEWEARNFGLGVVDLEESLRPKYGVINFNPDESITAGAAMYGSVALVLNKEALADRITFTPTNTSVTDATDVGTPEHFAPALANSKRALLGMGIPLEYVRGAVPGSPYTEAQIWGDLPINAETIEKIRVPYADTWDPEEHYLPLLM